MTGDCSSFFGFSPLYGLMAGQAYCQSEQKIGRNYMQKGVLNPNCSKMSQKAEFTTGLFFNLFL